MATFCANQKGEVTRKFETARQADQVCVTLLFDASPWGLGGVLLIKGIPVEYFSEPLTEADVENIGVEIGSNKTQAIAEALAVLVGARLWLEAWKEKRYLILTRSDSVAALGAVVAGRSPIKHLNAIVRELALDLAEGVYKMDVAKHIKGVNNVWADELSRWAQPGHVRRLPEELAGARQATPPARPQSWWRTMAEPLLSSTAAGSSPSSRARKQADQPHQ